MADAESRMAYRLWRLVRIDGKPGEMIISAKTGQAARELASDTVGIHDQSERHVWLDRRETHLTELGRASDEYRKTAVISIFGTSA